MIDDSSLPSERLARLRAEGGCFSVDMVARFAVTGADRQRYLNGQISNDLRKLAPGRAMQACILSAKGRLDAVVWIWIEPDRYIVECNAELAEPLAARLERYVVADDVEVAPVSVAQTIHVFGPASEAVSLGRRLFRLNLPGIDVAERPAGLCEATTDEVERLRIEGCVPKWGGELGPETLPAEAGLDLTAVDFHKGCYIGQEVVSRIQSVGHANRALRAFNVVEGPAPRTGAELFMPGKDVRPVAVVTSVHFALSPAVGLCYIRRGTNEAAVLTTAAGDSQIQIRPPVTLHA